MIEWFNFIRPIRVVLDACVISYLIIFNIKLFLKSNDNVKTSPMVIYNFCIKFYL